MCLALVMILDKIMDNVSDEECYRQINNIHYLVDNFSHIYALRAQTPKDQRKDI
jgi:hypothetical protein